MARSAGDGVGRLGVGQLCEIFRVEIVGHFDHQTGFVLDRVGIGGEVVAFGRSVAGVAEFAFDTEVALILMHELDGLVAGDVFGENLDVCGIGTWSAGWSGGLRCRSRSVLCRGEMSRESYHTHYERASKNPIHSDQSLCLNLEPNCATTPTARLNASTHGEFIRRSRGLIF